MERLLFRLKTSVQCIRKQQQIGDLENQSLFLKPYKRVDIRRATSLQDIELNVYPIYRTRNHRLAYQIKMKYPASELEWVVGRRYSEFHAWRQQVVAHLLRNADPLTCKSCRALCDLCFDGGHRRMKQRSQRIELMILDLFQYISTNAEELASCSVFVQVLRLTEKFLDLKYPHDRQALTLFTSMIDVTTNSAHDECPICLENFTSNSSAVMLGCGHQYHDSCICVWYNRKLSCPMCRNNGTP